MKEQKDMQSRHHQLTHFTLLIVHSFLATFPITRFGGLIYSELYVHISGLISCRHHKITLFYAKLPKSLLLNELLMHACRGLDQFN